jgi:oligoribonuclease
MPFFWIDLEMTGLDDAKDVILEVAAAVTDLDFNVLEELDRVVRQPQEALDRMDDWCKKTHGASGLTEKVKTIGEPLEKVEAELIALLDRHFPKKEDKVVLAGNSVGNDRRFIDRYLPAFAKRLHYRLIDVSSFKEVFRQKYGVK